MRRVEKLKVKIVDSTNAVECEERLNEILDTYAAYNPHVERDSNKPFCFYVTYRVTETVAESRVDEYELDGIKLYCRDCPYFVVPDDRRLGCRCGLTNYNAKGSDKMCDRGLNALEADDLAKRKEKQI